MDVTYAITACQSGRSMATISPIFWKKINRNSKYDYKIAFLILNFFKHKAYVIKNQQKTEQSLNI